MQKINSNDEWLSASEKVQPSEDGAVATPASKWPQQRKKVWIISILAFVAAIVGVIVIVATVNKQTTPSAEVSSVVLAADPGWPWSQAWAEFLNPSKKQDNSITINPFDNPGFAQQLQSSIKKEIDGSGIPTGAVIDY
ncbi:hypothetical protein BDR26DRAFT_890533 [Obelidium mucronatum]|nr:hypothetical protein BDR26DRAFT_890533 [Obelidium mucronatum]